MTNPKQNHEGYTRTGDPLIDEVRRRRAQISEECGHDMRRFAERIAALQRKHQDRLVKVPSHMKPKRSA
jgi:flagellar motility protein MotE (MotC chaperone)